MPSIDECSFPPMVHLIITAWVFMWSGYFQPTTWEHRNLPLEKVGACRLV